MAATAPAVFITVPKYVAITPNPNAGLPKIRPAPTTSLTTNTTIVATTPINVTMVEEVAAAPRGKKRRLDHLSWEEKIQRKKLKNRVAAQTSRDRKKARMEEMETEIDDLTQKTEILQNKCESLQAINNSLLEKNQKLDMEVELLRQQLNELQQQQQKQQESINQARASANTVSTCAGCESILKGSAAGINTNGLTVDRRATEKGHHAGVALEDCCPLPTLQDMLLLDEEFDAGKLEEFAESLLADITADMEASDGASNENVAQIAGSTERLPGSMVGTTAECMESSQFTSPPSDSLMNIETANTQALTNALQHKLQTAINNQTINANNNSTATTISAVEVIPQNVSDSEALQNINCTNESALQLTSPPPETVYGTYDANTTSIAIVMGDDAVPVNEAVEEIYCDGVTVDEDCIKCPTPAASPSQVFLNVVECSDDEDDLNFDPIECFLRPKRPLISPLAKSPAPSLHSATSDHGYESIMGSPTSTATDHFDASAEDFVWTNTFNDLFPSLI